MNKSVSLAYVMTFLKTALGWNLWWNCMDSSYISEKEVFCCYRMLYTVWKPNWKMMTG